MTPFDLRDAPDPALRHDVADLLARLPRIDADPRPLGQVRARLGERPVLDPVAGALLWVDVLAGRVHRWPAAAAAGVDPDRGDVWDVGSAVGVAWPTGSGGVLAAAVDGLVVTHRWVPAHPAPSHPALRADLPPGHRWNDGATDPAGRLWLVAMPADDATAPGTVHRITPTGDTTVLTGVTCGNGIQFSPDGRWMYLTDTVHRVLYRLPYDSNTGTPGAPEPFFALAADGPLPDGTTVDADGSLWVPIWRAGAVLRLDPSGRPVDALHLPTPLVTCLAIGPNGRAWVTTAGDPGERLGDPGAADGAGAVFEVRLPGVRPLPVWPIAGG